MTTETTARKETQKLQRAIVDGLEDVKAQDLQVFNTEHLSALFERVIIASGSSNRQTKALASSVRDAVRDAGFPKPRMEGEANGEWIIVDCGRAVVHVMQPSIRAYYNLEEIWGGTPVRLKFGAARPEVAPTVKAVAKPGARKPATKKSESNVAPAYTAKRKSATKTVVNGETSPSLRRSSAVKTAARAAKAAAEKPIKAAPRAAVRSRAQPAVKKPAAKRAPARKA